MTTASLAVTVSRPDQEPESEWFNIAAFGSSAEALVEQHKKGDLIAAMGQLVLSRFVGRDGEERTSWSLTFDGIVGPRSMRPAGRPRSSGATSRAPQHGYAGPVPDDGLDDLFLAGSP